MSGVDSASESGRESELRERLEFLGFQFDILSMDTLIRFVAARASGERFDYVVTPNVDHVVQLHRNLALLEPLYRDAAFTVCDSRILSLLARTAGLRLPPVPGSDLTARMFEEAIKPDDSVLVVGGRAAEIERLRSIYGLRRLLHHDPPMNLITDRAAMAEAVRFAVEHPARYVFLALGSPQQEMIAHQIWQTGEANGTAFCVGASIDFLTGRAKRAPKALQRLKLEWLHRLAREPGRLWRRYLVDDMRVFAIYWRWRRDRRSK